METDNEYWRLICEKDQAWDDFCDNPSDNNWYLYLNAQNELGKYIIAMNYDNQHSIPQTAE